MVAEGAARPFCGGKDEREAFDRWAVQLEAVGVELREPDRFVVGLLASREARLEALGRELRREKDSGRRLRLVAAERLAASDMQKALDMAERVFGGAAAEAAEAVPGRVVATGTDGRVVEFTSAAVRGLSVVAQRIVATVAKGSRPLTKEQLRRGVPGAEHDFLKGMKAAIQAGAVRRRGSGTRGRPYTYERGEA